VQERDRTEAIQETYRLLAVAVFAGMVGGWLGSRSMDVVRFFCSGLGLIVAIVSLNVIPSMTINIARKNPRMGVPYLAGFGFISGLVLSPLIFLAMLKSGMGTDAPNLVQAALVVTATIFAGISGYVYKSGTRFQAGQAYMSVAFWAIMAAIFVNYFILPGSGLLGIGITVAIGLFGGVSLVMSSAKVLNDPEFREPVVGALCIFAGLFNLFQAVLRLLMIFGGGGRRP
jgi:FtsH-binding integral membrane protein